jgi:Protein of unknown function (DUF3048) N-terminal domain/Protein of unknown function (DUF3048) C-terminal domain
MKISVSMIALFIATLGLSACSPGLLPTEVTIPTNIQIPIVITVYPTPTQGATPTETPIPATATPSYPAQGRGPTGFAANVDPLTGLEVTDPNLLNRRTIAIKIENIPRGDRPQWGLSDADLVFEYYTEEGATRFNAVFYGQNSAKVGPIRSGRFFDTNVVQMYKSIFIFGYAWKPEMDSFINSDFGNRLVLEGDYTKPTLFRTTGEGNYDLLFANLNTLPDLLTQKKIDNTKQNLDGMLFNPQISGTSQLVNQVTIRFSSVVYNRWDYDAASNKYIRSQDTVTAENVKDEIYKTLTDRNSGLPITADNVVILYAPYEVYVKTALTEVYKLLLYGTGPAYIMRDGKIYQVTWRRNASSDVVTLVGGDGQLFPFKPGNTWFEVIGVNSTIAQPAANAWRFTLSLR